jgi:hypothetical protein
MAKTNLIFHKKKVLDIFKGTCNEPWECNCLPNWGGKLCNEPRTSLDVNPAEAAEFYNNNNQPNNLFDNTFDNLRNQQGPPQQLPAGPSPPRFGNRG